MCVIIDTDAIIINSDKPLDQNKSIVSCAVDEVLKPLYENYISYCETVFDYDGNYLYNQVMALARESVLGFLPLNQIVKLE